MADRSIKVRLSAEVSDFTREMGKASTSLDQLVKQSGDASGAANTTMGRLVQSARLQSDAWNTAGGALAGAGAAITAVNVAVAKTGIEYNTLQQTSRAALTTMLGSTEAVNAQMDKLDDFARTSPFSKATFITAQQQMLAFGIEAEKVVPYLSAINDATAAAGGNNQTLSELAFIMAQISAAGKITAQDLMQFGQRGVNAAELIGDAMGKTGPEIRDSITKGTLGADEALDALAQGMKTKFDGASANVKETMAGAFDRVKAAFRDLSADMMSSAVSPDGGGWLVDLTNGVADLMRAVQRLPDPVKSATGAISGITGVAALAGGGVLLAVPKFVQLHDAFKTLSEVSPRLSDGLKGVGKAAGIAMGALAVLTVVNSVATAMEAAATGADNAEAAFKRLASGTGDLDSVFQKINGKPLFSAIGQQVDDLDSAFERFATRGIRHMDQLDGFMNGLFGGESALSRLHDQFALLDTQLTSMSTAEAADAFTHLAERAEAAGVTIDDLLEIFPQYAGQIQLLAANHGLAELSGQELVDAMKGLNPELAAAADAAEAATGEQQELAQAMLESAEAAEAAEKEYVEYLNSLASGSQSFTDLGTALDAAQAKHRETAESIAEATKSGEDSWEDFYDGTSVSINQYLAELEKQIEAQNNWEANMLELSGRASQGLIDHLAEMGAKGAPLVAALVDATDEELQRMERNFRESGSQSSMDWAEGLAEGAAAWAALGQKMGSDVVREAAQEVAAGKATLQNIIDRYDLQATINANTDPAIRAAEAAMSRISRMSATVRVRAYHANGLDAPLWTGGRVGDVAAAYGLAGGGSPRWVGDSGRVFGPGSPTADKVSARISPDEFVHQARAAKYYGYDTMYALNAMRIPREALTPYLAAGGTPGGTPSVVAPVTSPAAAGPALPAGPVTARLAREDIDLLARTVVSMAQGVSHRTVDSALMALGRGV